MEKSDAIFPRKFTCRDNSGGGVYPDEVGEICSRLAEASRLFGNIME